MNEFVVHASLQKLSAILLDTCAKFDSISSADKRILAATESLSSVAHTLEECASVFCNCGEDLRVTTKLYKLALQDSSLINARLNRLLIGGWILIAVSSVFVLGVIAWTCLKS